MTNPSLQRGRGNSTGGFSNATGGVCLGAVQLHTIAYTSLHNCGFLKKPFSRLEKLKPEIYLNKYSITKKKWPCAK